MSLKGMWDKEKRELKSKVVKHKFTSKELYGMLRQEQKEMLPVLRIHYKSKLKSTGASIMETCGLLRVKEIKKIAKKLFSIKYNRKELLSLISKTTK